MKLPWPFPHFVSSLLCQRERGFDAVRTLYGQGGKGQFLRFLRTSLWTAPYELTKLYTAKNVLWTRISVQNDFIEERLVFTSQGRQKSEEHNAI